MFAWYKKEDEVALFFCIFFHFFAFSFIYCLVLA